MSIQAPWQSVLAVLYQHLIFKGEIDSWIYPRSIFFNRIRFSKFYPMKSERHAHETLNSFIHEVGIMHELHSETLFQGEMAKKIRQFEIFLTFSEPYSQGQNFSENRIKQVKNTAQYFLQWKNTPIRIWTHAFVYATEILNQITSTHVAAHGRTPFIMIHSYTPDISEYVLFE